MTTNDIKEEILDFMKRINIAFLPSLSFNSKRAALDAIESLTTLVSVISEDSMKAGVNTDIESFDDIIKELDNVEDPSKYFTEDELKANIKDPFGNDTLESVVESIDPNFDKTKLGAFREYTVGQYLQERTASSFIADLRELFLRVRDDPYDPKTTAEKNDIAKSISKRLVRKPELRQGIKEPDRTDRLSTKKGYLITSKSGFLDEFLNDIINECNKYSSKKPGLDFHAWGHNSYVVNALALIYRSYIAELQSNMTKEDVAEDVHSVARQIAIKLAKL